MAIRSIGATNPVLPARPPRDARDNDNRDPAVEFETELRQRGREPDDDDEAGGTGRDDTTTTTSSSDDTADEPGDAERTGSGEEPGHVDEYA